MCVFSQFLADFDAVLCKRYVDNRCWFWQLLKTLVCTIMERSKSICLHSCSFACRLCRCLKRVVNVEIKNKSLLWICLFVLAVNQCAASAPPVDVLGNYSGGTITSQNYPNYYPCNADCRWLITSAKIDWVVRTFYYLFNLTSKWKRINVVKQANNLLLPHIKWDRIRKHE